MSAPAATAPGPARASSSPGGRADDEPVVDHLDRSRPGPPEPRRQRRSAVEARRARPRPRGRRASRAAPPANRSGGGRRGRRRSGRTAAPPRRGCGSRGRSSGPTAAASRSPPGRRRRPPGRAPPSARRGRDRRLVEQRPGDGELLLHALAERARDVVPPVPQREEPQVALDPRRARRGVQAVEPPKNSRLAGADSLS